MRIKIVVTDLTYEDGRVSGSMTTSMTEDGKTVTHVQDFGTEKPKRKAKPRRAALRSTP